MGCVCNINFTVAIGIGSSELFFCKHIEFCYMTLNSGYVADIYISISIGIAEDKQLLVCQNVRLHPVLNQIIPSKLRIGEIITQPAFATFFDNAELHSDNDIVIERYRFIRV